MGYHLQDSLKVNADKPEVNAMKTSSPAAKDTRTKKQEKLVKYSIRTVAILGVVAGICLSYPRSGPAQAATSPSPTRDGQHDFDFNIGVWHTHIKRFLNPFESGSESIELNGTVTVRKVWDGRAQLEEIETDGPKGHWEGLTLFLYNPKGHQWSQSFVNSKVGIVSGSPNVGAFKDGRAVLIGQDTLNDQAILVRAVWSDITPESHHYVESYSNDGGTTWVTAFTANLTRIK